MKVLFAIKTIVSAAGGAERVAVTLCNELARKGLDISLLTFDSDSAAPFYQPDPIVARYFMTIGDTGQKIKGSEYPKLLLGIRKQITALKPDIVVAFMHSIFVPLQLALLGTGIKVILSEHTVPAYYQSRKIEFLALGLMSQFAAAIAVPTEQAKDLYPAFMRRKMQVLPNPVSSNFKKANSGLKISQLKKLLTVGRLEASKDYVILIEAFSLIKDEFPDWILSIAGEGPERSSLENLIKKLKLEDRVEMLGLVKDVDDLYVSAQLFVIPSRYESLGLVTLEAMSHALPVVGFEDCEGTKNIINHEKTGLLVPQRSAQSLSRALKILMSSATLRQIYGENAFSKLSALGMDQAQHWQDFITYAANA